MNNNISVILCRPQLWLNLGATARVMSNMDFSDLRIVNPRDKDIINKAYEAASHADYILDNAKTFDTIEDAIADLSYVAMTSARPRDMEKEVCDLGDLSSRIPKNLSNIGIVFGPERTGLTNEELALANTIVTLQTGQNNKSYNLSHAIAIVLYQIFSDNSHQNTIIPPDIATKNDITNLLYSIENLLDSKGYFKEQNKKRGQILNIKNIFSRNYITKQDIKTIYGIINSIKS